MPVLAKPEDNFIEDERLNPVTGRTVLMVRYLDPDGQETVYLATGEDRLDALRDWASHFLFVFHKAWN